MLSSARIAHLSSCPGNPCLAVLTNQHSGCCWRCGNCPRQPRLLDRNARAPSSSTNSNKGSSSNGPLWPGPYLHCPPADPSRPRHCSVSGPRSHPNTQLSATGALGPRVPPPSSSTHTGCLRADYAHTPKHWNQSSCSVPDAPRHTHTHT